MKKFLLLFASLLSYMSMQAWEIWYDNSINLWDEVYVYAWDEWNIDVSDSWPGSKMTDTEGNLWHFVGEGRIPIGFILNNGKGNQSSDLTYFQSSWCYQLSGSLLSGLYFIRDRITFNILSHQVKTCEVVKYFDTPQKTKVTVPNYVTIDGLQCMVTKIGYQAFYRSEYLESVVLNEGISIIGPYAFSESKLTTVYLPYGVTEIQHGAFQDCKNLKEISLPMDLNSIGNQAFAGSGLESIEIPENVTTLDVACFSDCNLTQVKCDALNPPIGDYSSFDYNTYRNAELIIPEVSKGLYRITQPWLNFKLFNEVEATQIILNTDNAKLSVGETIQLTASVYPANTSNKTVTWISWDPYVAEVSESGLVTALSDGRATITASCGNVSATCIINVVTEAEQVILNIEYAELNIGKTIQLNATVLPENTTYKTVTWKSSDPNVAKVYNTGHVRAVSEGTAIITASCGNVSATCEIVVKAPEIDAEQILLNHESFDLNIGETLQLKATVLPENTTDKSLSWNSSDSNVASVSNTGLVTANSVGSAIITVSCGEVSAECVINIREDAGVESILANPDTKISVYSTEGVLIRKDCKVEDLKLLDNGIYIIVSGKERYKISI